MYNGSTWIRPTDRLKLLRAMMDGFAGDGVALSLEGRLPDRLKAFRPQLDFSTLPAFKRQTQAPVLDFVAIPLDASTLPAIQHEILNEALLVGEHAAIEHLQIGDREKLYFGAYDGFHEECVVVYEGAPHEALRRMKASGLIRPLKTERASEEKD